MSHKHRLFEYAPQCVMAGRIIDDTIAESRGLVTRNARGSITRISDDLIDLGNYTERGHLRVNGPKVSRYF